MTAKKNPKPEPVVTAQVCSVCDQKWADHGDAEEITLLDCITALKKALVDARRPNVMWNGSVSTITPLQNTA